MADKKFCVRFVRFVRYVRFVYDMILKTDISKTSRSASGFCPGAFLYLKIMFSLEQIQKMISDGDVSPFYNDRYWRNLTAEIIKKNRNECTLCKQRGKYTPAQMVHHIKPLKQSPELAYDRDNLMPLCNDCHDRVHKRGAYCERRGYRNAEKW